MLKIYRKESAYLPVKLSKAEQAEATKRVEALSRVKRPELTHFLVSGDFYKLAPIPSNVVNNPALRKLDYSDCGWEIPMSDLGKTGENTQAQSIKLWIGKNLPMVNLDEIAICVE